MAIGDELLRQDPSAVAQRGATAADGRTMPRKNRAGGLPSPENTWASCQRQVRDTKVANDVFTVTRPLLHPPVSTAASNGAPGVL